MPATKRSPEGSSKSKPDRTVAQLDELQRAGKDGDVALPGRVKLHVSSLDKVWFPKTKRSGALTKGDVMRYYARVAPYILPALKDRPLSLKRFPNGIEGEFFFQQKAPPNPPAGVRVETVESERGEKQERLIGGSLSTLLYCTQIGAFECNPWNARVQSLEHPDFTVIDLDPGPKAPFRRVVEIALWVKEALDHLGLHGVAKTSGATGMHIVLPLPRSSTESTAERVAQVVATAVAGAHPKAATVERSIAARGDAKVYVDFGQNSRGKTVAAAYGVRARPGATVSTPLRWDELTPDLDPGDFTIETVPARIAQFGDLYGTAMKKANPAKLVTDF